MRYGVIADIHGNLEALKSVLEALAAEGVDAYVSAGDIIGYGADPRECLRVVRSLNPAALVAGNHEWGVLDILDLSYFNDVAKAAVVWTKGVLTKEDIEYIGSFALMHDNDLYTVVHGSYDAPEEFNYIDNAHDAVNTINRMRTNICFVGHTHSPGIFYETRGTVEYSSQPYTRFEYGKKYVVNVGSVGQPRDGDPRACYAVFDDREGTVDIKRAAYDIPTAQKKIRYSGLPDELAVRLAEGA